MRALILVMTLLTMTTPALAYDKQALMDGYFGVVMIRGYNTNGGLAYGSGVVVDKNKVITNCHVFRTTNKPWVARGEDTYNITSVKADTWHDLCLVTTDTLPFKPVKIGKSTSLKRGQEVAGIGHSNGVPAPLTSSGGVIALYEGNPGKIIRTSAKFLMGASGSGLFDLDGNLVGINTFKTAGIGGSIHYALPIEWLENLEKQTEVSTFPITGKALWEEDEDKKPFYMQAAVPESRQDWPKLLQVAKNWTEAEPKNTEAWFTLGFAQEQLADRASAKKSYEQAFKTDTTNFDALIHLGSIAKSSGDTEELHRIQLELAAIDQDVAKEYSQMMGCSAAC
jgi:serine protease Do